MWEIEGTDEFAAWYHALTDEQQGAINEAVVKLEEHGPSLGRPLVDTLSHTHLPNLKELRPLGTFIRVLFAFVPDVWQSYWSVATSRIDGANGIENTSRLPKICTRGTWTNYGGKGC